MTVFVYVNTIYSCPSLARTSCAAGIRLTLRRESKSQKHALKKCSEAGIHPIAALGKIN
jgi:hypothetical protein